MATLAEELTPYGVPADYPDLFWRNVRVADRVDERASVRALVEEVSRAVGVPYSDVLIDFKRYLLTSWEYHPSQLTARRGISLRYLLTLFYFALFSTWSPGKRERQVLIDDWTDDSLRTFYGHDLTQRLSARWEVEATDLTRYHHVCVSDLVKLLPKYPRLSARRRRLALVEGVDLSHYLFVVLTNALAGQSLKRRFRPTVALSGNDNGFPLIKARAAGMRIVTIQNGARPPLSDAAFISADRYLAMGGPKFDRLRADLGCRFGRTHSVGSIRLSHYLRARGTRQPPQRYSILFVSDLEGESRTYDATFGHCYAMSFEEDAIALLNALAERSEASVAYYPRFDDDSTLRRLGLRSEQVTYLERHPGGVYAAAEAARIVLSTSSTVGLEAMGLQRTIGFVNLSGNRSLNGPFAEEGLDYGGEDGTSLGEFIASLEARTVEREQYLSQHEDVGRAVAEVVGEEIEQAIYDQPLAPTAPAGSSSALGPEPA